MTDDFRVKDVLSLCVDWTSIASSRASVDQFVDAVDGGYDPFDDRRAAQRKPAMIDVIAVPLDADRQPCGDAFLALTRNISHGGIAILCTEQVKAPYLLLRLEMARYRCLQAVVRVIRSRSFYQFTEVSAAFALTEEQQHQTNSKPRKARVSGSRGTKAASGRRKVKRAVAHRPSRAV
ncbi:MAG TPA: hypothetical protein VGP63_28315 [Planctomycetaceae bacterium]|jgi:hypothetical protein|nr:hypothetical protein [Planctomycetaceae bacterium]